MQQDYNSTSALIAIEHDVGPRHVVAAYQYVCHHPIAVYSPPLELASPAGIAANLEGDVLILVG